MPQTNAQAFKPRAATKPTKPKVPAVKPRRTKEGHVIVDVGKPLTGVTLAFWLLSDPPGVPCRAEWFPHRRKPGGFWQLTVLSCPYCSKGRWPTTHIHGGGDRKHPSGGHRVAHCLEATAANRAGYILMVTERVVKPTD
jgi:hypothetical protein